MEKKIIKIIYWIKDFWQESIAMVVGPILLAIPSFFAIPIFGKWVVIITAFVLLVLGFCHVIRKRDRITNLKSKLADLQNNNKILENQLTDYGINNFHIFNKLLSIIFDNLHLTNDERISIFKINHLGEVFNIIGRHSSSYEYGKLGKRRFYPIGEGYIGKVINMGDGYILTDNELPAFVNGCKKDYYTCLTRHGVAFDKDSLKNMRMVSRAYLCKVLYNTETRPVAVIVFESKRHGIISSKKDTINILIDTYKDILIELCEKSKIVVPDPEYAKQIGF